MFPILVATLLLHEGGVGVLAGRYTGSFGFDQVSAVNDKASVPCGELEKMYSIKEGLTIGSFSLGKCLGGGSFGEVWEAFPVDKSSFKAVIKISKVPFGEKDFRGQDQAENSLKECLYARAMTERDMEHFAGCFEMGTFNVNGKGDAHVALMYVVSEFVEGRDMQNALFNSKDAAQELPTLATVIDAELQLYDAFDSMLHAGEDGTVFFHNDLQPSNLLISAHEGVVHLTVLDYGEATICCDVGARCEASLEDNGIRDKLGLTYGEQIESCSQQTRLGNTIKAEGVDHTATFLVLNFLAMLCTPSSGHGQLFGPILQHNGDAEDVVVHKAMDFLRAAYKAELEDDDSAKTLLVDVIRAGFRDTIRAAKEETWPPKDFIAKVKALGEYLNA